jgi:hypothetical protein
MERKKGGSRHTKKSQEKNSEGVTFLCGVCGKVAATVTLAAPGQPDPRLTPEPEGVPKRISRVFLEVARLAVDGGPVTHTVSVPSNQVDHVKAALLARNAAELNAMDRDFAPFWCPVCTKSYCKEHYASFPLFDDGYYDCTETICPQGHKRRVAD